MERYIYIFMLRITIQDFYGQAHVIKDLAKLKGTEKMMGRLSRPIIFSVPF